MSQSIDELMEGLDVNTSNDIVIKEIKDFKRVIIKSIDKFNSYIKLETKKKDIEKKGIKKKDTAKEHIEKVNAKKIASNMMLIINQLLVLILRHI